MRNILAKASAAAFIFLATGTAHARPACTTIILPSISIVIDGLSDEDFAQITPVLTKTGSEEALGLIPIGQSYQSETYQAGQYTIALQYEGETLVSKDIEVTEGVCHVNTARVEFSCTAQSDAEQAAGFVCQ